MKSLAILGSTGSIGRSALKVVAQFPDRFRVAGLTAGRNVRLLLEQIRATNPEIVAVSDHDSFRQLSAMFRRRKRPEILCGREGVEQVAQLTSADTVISAISGSAGLMPTIAAVRAGKALAIANKETLVMAGSILLSETEKYGASLLPVDSEHSAVFQCMNGEDPGSVRKVLLTASGGPFLNKSAAELRKVTPRDALKHPNWKMGEKITVDSATLMNKGLEVIEAFHLFRLPLEKIDVLVHPQSVIHALIEFNDGSYLAHLSRPDMRAPIAYALSWPDRLERVIEPIDWKRLSALTFLEPDTRRFPCLALAYEAIRAGGTMPAVLNAANEVAVNAFLNEAVRFRDIPAIIRKTMDFHVSEPADDIETVVEADRWARETSMEAIKRR
ncbi:MAG: 1-deoxy-D-xylulose-5-phosphate reductoisomerase [Chloroflexota bacterium]